MAIMLPNVIFQEYRCLMTETEDDQYEESNDDRQDRFHGEIVNDAYDVYLDRISKLAVTLEFDIQDDTQLTVLQLILNHTDEVDISEDSPYIDDFLDSTLTCLVHYPEHMPIKVREWLDSAVRGTMNDPTKARKHFHLSGKNAITKRLRQQDIELKSFYIVTILSDHFATHSEDGSGKANPGVYFVAGKVLDISPSTAALHCTNMRDSALPSVMMTLNKAKWLKSPSIITLITEEKIDQCIKKYKK